MNIIIILSFISALFAQYTGAKQGKLDSANDNSVIHAMTGHIDSKKKIEYEIDPVTGKVFDGDVTFQKNTNTHGNLLNTINTEFDRTQTAYDNLPTDTAHADERAKKNKALDTLRNNPDLNVGMILQEQESELTTVRSQILQTGNLQSNDGTATGSYGSSSYTTQQHDDPALLGDYFSYYDSQVPSPQNPADTPVGLAINQYYENNRPYIESNKPYKISEYKIPMAAMTSFLSINTGLGAEGKAAANKEIILGENFKDLLKEFHEKRYVEAFRNPLYNSFVKEVSKQVAMATNQPAQLVEDKFRAKMSYATIQSATNAWAYYNKNKKYRRMVNNVAEGAFPQHIDIFSKIHDRHLNRYYAGLLEDPEEKQESSDKLNDKKQKDVSIGAKK